MYFEFSSKNFSIKHDHQGRSPMHSLKIGDIIRPDRLIKLKPANYKEIRDKEVDACIPVKPAEPLVVLKAEK